MPAPCTSDLTEAATQPTDAALEFPDALALDTALQKLESPATIKREWSLAKAWLYRELASA